MIPFEQLPCDGAGLAVANGPAVALRYGRDLGAGARQETLIRAVDIVPCQGHLLHRDLRRPSEFDDSVSCHAFENSGDKMRRAQDAVLDEKDIISGAFGDL